jgi:dTDP-4-dehydrorhamnose reductase
MRVLITGGSGFFGQHLVPLASNQHTVAYTYFSTDPLEQRESIHLDLRDESAVLHTSEHFQPDVIIHTAGSNRSPAMESVIIEGARNIVRLARLTGARLIHLSSDVVFDGTAAPYDEAAATNPVHAYGRAKETAEHIVAAWHNHVIVRTSLIYSLRLIDAGSAWMRREIEENRPITLFTNHYRNPIHADTLAASCLELLTRDYVGILHIAGSQDLTRADFAHKMLTYWRVPLDDNVHFGPDRSGRFPCDCRLDIRRAQTLLQTPLRGVDDHLRRHRTQSS